MHPRDETGDVTHTWIVRWRMLGLYMGLHFGYDTVWPSLLEFGLLVQDEGVIDILKVAVGPLWLELFVVTDTSQVV